MPGDHLTIADLTKDQYIRLRMGGVSYIEMSIMYNCGKNTIHTKARVWGVGRIKPDKSFKTISHLTKSDLMGIQLYFNEGFSDAEIGDALNIGCHIVYKARVKMGLITQPSRQECARNRAVRIREAKPAKNKPEPQGQLSDTEKIRRQIQRTRENIIRRRHPPEDVWVPSASSVWGKF